MALTDTKVGSKKADKIDLMILREGRSYGLKSGVYFHFKFDTLDEPMGVVISAKYIGKVKAEIIDRVVCPSGIKRKLEEVLGTKTYGSLIEPFIDNS